MLGRRLTGLNFESCVWRAVTPHSSHHPQEVLFTQFSLYVYKCGVEPHLLAPAVNVGETEGAMDSTSVFFWPLLLPIRK